MGTPAEINQGTTSVNGTLLPSDKFVDVVQLVLAVRKHLPEILLGDFQSVETLLLFENLVGPVVEGLPVGLFYDTAARCQ